MLVSFYRLTGGIWTKYDVIAKPKSVIWDKRFYSVGSFQIRTDRAPCELYDIVTYGDNSGIVLRIKQNYEYTEIYGYDLKGIAKFRQYPGQTLTSDTNAETLMRGWVQNYLMTGDKAVEGLTLSAAHGYEPKIPQGEIEKGTLSDVLEEQGKNCAIGWDIKFDFIQKNMSFDFILSNNNPTAVFSREHKNIESAERIRDAYDEVNSLTGIRLREGDTENPASDYITAEANGHIHPGTDYSLGDIVTVKEFGESGQLQVTELKYVYETNKILVIPTFGEAKDNIIKKIVKEVQKQNG